MPYHLGMPGAHAPQGASHFVVRPARPHDSAAIIAVANAAFAVEDFMEGTRTDEARLAAVQMQGEFLVAEDAHGQIAGTVFVQVSGEQGYFGMLSVDPRQQGRGLGRLLVGSAEDYCRQRGCREININVLSLRPELLPFYRNLGYVETGTEEFHPSRPLKAGMSCHCIVMMKSL